MHEHRYALQVISHQKFRSIIVFLLVFITTACVFGNSLFTSNLQAGTEKLRGRISADLMVVPAEYMDSAKDMLFRGTACTLLFPSDVAAHAADAEGIAAVSPQLYLETLAFSCCTAGGLQIVAYDPKTDFSVRQWSRKSTELRADEVLAGHAGGFTKGASVDLFGKTYTVAEVLEETGMGYDQSLFLTYEAANAITGSADYAYMFGERQDLISMLLVKADAQTDLSAAEKALASQLHSDALSVYAVDEIADELSRQLRTFAGFGRILNLFSVLLAGVALFALVTLTFHQRRSTAGSMLSVGIRKSTILRMFLAEYLWLFLAGTIAGFVLVGIVFLPLHDVIKTALGMPYKLLSFADACRISFKTAAVNLLMLAVAFSYTFVRIMKTEPALLTGETT
ncbi:MAG TPA: hypothetical protein DCG49_06980 [Ruminococcus sp.]|nr:hypothetical protein [Ruminococcus sp.]